MKWLLLAVVMLTTVAGDVLQSREMKLANRSGAVTGLAPLLSVIASRRWLMAAIFCMAVSFFAFLRLLQIAPLSFAVPASAGTFIIETVLARILLKETIDLRRAAGTVIVLCGIMLLAD